MPPFPQLKDHFSFESEISGRSFCIVTEKINGVPLSEIQILSEEQAKNIIKQILEVLSYLNLVGFVHRDIRPTNIIYDQSANRICLIDFDLARRSFKTSYTLIEPTGFYPPDAYALYPSPNIDLVALGRVILSIATGQQGEALEIFSEGKFEDLINQLPYSEEFKQFLRYLIESDPNKRIFQNAQEALQYLENPDEFSAQLREKEISSPKDKKRKREHYRKILKQLAESLIKIFERRWMMEEEYRC